MANNPPDIRPWFGPEKVLKAVGDLDNVNAGGSTWAQIRDFLVQQHQQPLLPDLDTVLRRMLAVFCRKGHLTTITRGGPRRYTRRQAPALVEIPGYLWWYYLGFKLGYNAVVWSAGKRRYCCPNFPPWFGPEAVLRAVGELDKINNDHGGPTCEEIKDRLMRTHQPQLPPRFGRLLHAMLAVLRQRGHLTRKAAASDQQQQHSMWRHAPATIDIDNDLICYYVGYKLGGGYGVPELGKAAADVGLRQRLGKKSAKNPRKKEGITITKTETQPLLPPDDHRDVHRPTAGATRQQVDGVGVPQNTGSLETCDMQGTIDALIDMPHNDQARRQEMREQQRNLYMYYVIWSMSVSFCGHAIVLGLSFIPLLGEETGGHHTTSQMWLKWGVMNLLVPLLLLAAMIVVQRFFSDLEDTSSDEEHAKAVKWNKTVNLWVISCSKIVYVVIKEAPGPHVTLRVIAHVVDFLIDLGGAIYLCRKLSQLDQDLPI